MATDGQINAYFSHLATRLHRSKDVFIVAVAHMVSNTLSFAPALDNIASLSCILVKPKSSHRPERDQLETQFKFKLHSLNREWAANPQKVVDLLHSLNLRKCKVILVDIGGYFAGSLDEIAAKFDGELLGLLEGTENGIHKYESNLPKTVPIATVARSPLKLPEDFLVGSSVVFSIEAVLRESAQILQTRTALVIGYGRVGSSIAEILRGRGIGTSVYDTKPARLAEAAAKGFRAYKHLNRALENASLVVCATGNKSLDLKGFALLKNGCVVASVTSADDEFDLAALQKEYIRSEISRDLIEYQEVRASQLVRSFSLVADGNAANFLHGAVIGPAIQLIEGEKLAAIRDLIDRKAKVNSIYEVSDDTRDLVAGIWNAHFLS
jgi:adenosylhomocysteinase